MVSKQIFQPAVEPGGERPARALALARGAPGLHVVLVGIAAWRDHEAVLHHGVAVADEHGAEHADVGIAHVRQRGELDALAAAVGAFDDGHGRIRAAVAQEKALRFHNLPRAAAALGVVEGHHKIGVSHGIQPARNGGPGREQIRQRDGTKVVRERRAHQGRAAVEGRGAGHHFHHNAACFGRAVFVHSGRRPPGLEQHFKRGPGHAVHACIARRDERHLLALAGALQRFDGAVQLFGHGLADDLFALDEIGHQLDVGDVADDGVGLGNGGAGARRHVLGAAGANAHEHDFSCGHGISPCADQADATAGAARRSRPSSMQAASRR